MTANDPKEVELTSETLEAFRLWGQRLREKLPERLNRTMSYDLPDPLQDAPEGFCRLASERNGIYFVKGRTQSYECSAHKNECSCFDWAYRRAHSLSPCRHLRMLSQWLALEPCPLCDEQGCIGCDGMGRVSCEEFFALKELNEQDRKEIFA